MSKKLSLYRVDGTFAMFSRGHPRRLGCLLLSVFVASLGITSGVPAATGHAVDIKSFAGDYEFQSPNCKLQEGKTSERCSSDIKDRMTIERIDDDNARVVVHSYQTNEHVCHVDGVASRTKDGLKYCLEYEPETCLSLTFSAEEIALHLNIDRNHHVPFCGGRATLDGLKVPRSSRLDPARCLHQAH